MRNNNIKPNNCKEEVEKKFRPRKLEALTLSEAYRFLGEERKSERVKNCGSFLEFAVSADDWKLHQANFCRDRLCPLCNWRRSMKIFSQTSAIMDELQKQGFRFLFLTLTVRNCEFHELEQTVSALIDGYKKLYRKTAFKKVVSGSFRTLEITVNKETCTFHPHLHVILAVLPTYFNGQNYISQSKWAEMWQEACGLDYLPITDIRAVKSGKLDDLEGIDAGQTKTYKSAIKEMSHYVAKGSDYLEGEFEEILVRVSHLLDALTGRRLCSMTGVFKTVAAALRLDDMEEGDLVHTEIEVRSDVAEMIVRYHWRAGVYEMEVIEND